MYGNRSLLRQTLCLCALLVVVGVLGCGHADEPPESTTESNESQPDEDAARDKLYAVTDGGRQLGTRYDVVLYTHNRDAGEAALKSMRSLAAELEARLSEWQPDSEITLLNQQAGLVAVAIKPDVYSLLRGALAVSDATGGAFDITFKPLASLWQQAADQDRKPTDTEIAEILDAVGYEKVVLNKTTIRFRQAATKIGIGGFGKGWIIDKLYKHLCERGMENFVINIGGDLRISGNNEKGEAHQLNVVDPFDTEKTLGTFPANDVSVATSGLSFRYREIGGKRYGHIIDPRTGHPAAFQGSVTVITRDAAMADALATALFVMGPEEGMKFAERQEGLWVLFADKSGVIQNIQGFQASAKE